LCILTLAALLLGALAPSALAQDAYVTNKVSNNVSVIDTQTNQVGSPIRAGGFPRAIAITPDGTTAYVANALSDSLSVIDIKTNRVGTRSGSASARRQSRSPPSSLSG
jgi:YVTN family beta-propeller protein